jgi:hypothetical protein
MPKKNIKKIFKNVAQFKKTLLILRLENQKIDIKSIKNCPKKRAGCITMMTRI